MTYSAERADGYGLLSAGVLLDEYGWRLVEQAGPSYFRDTYIRPTGRTLSASPLEWTALAER